MRILWLKSDLLLPLDKGGKLRTWHLMRHLARRHEITYLSFAEPGQPAADVEGMREVARARGNDHAHASPPKGTLRFYADAALHLVDPLPYAVAQVPVGGVPRAGCERCSREQPFDLIVCDFLFPAVNLPQRLPCPAVIFTHNVESEIWRRHAGHQGAAPLGRLLYGMQYRRMLRYERPDARAASTACSPCRTPTARRFARLYPGRHQPSRSTSSRPASTRNYFTPRPAQPPAAAAPRLHRLDGLAAERRRDAVLLPRRPAAHPRRRSPTCTLSIVGRAPTPAVSEAGRRRRRPRHRPRRRRAAVHEGRGGLRRAAAHRRRHAPEDLRGDGDGQGGRLHDRRRRRAAGDARRARADRRRAADVRPRGRPPDPRRRAPARSIEAAARALVVGALRLVGGRRRARRRTGSASPSRPAAVASVPSPLVGSRCALSQREPRVGWS